MMKKIFALLIILSVSWIFAQDNPEFFPDDLTILPFTANTLEPRLGTLFQLGENELQLDIGNSVDLLRYRKNDGATISFGADLFTYTQLRGEKNFHFPVDAVDYLFGINSCYKKIIDAENQYGARLRLSHISAHFADGHYDGIDHQWRDNRNPQVYSREFLELMPFYKINTFRAYIGITYIFHVTPSTIKKDNYQVGFDYYFKNLFSEKFFPFIAYDYKLIHLDQYSANHSVYLGIKFGKLEGKGFSVYISYYNGKSIHGEYFDVNKEYIAAGINLDL